MQYIISYDIGTSGIKCGIFNEQLQCMVITRSDYAIQMSADGTVEAEPMDYINGMVQCTHDALAKGNILPAEVVSMCITTQGETLIPVDALGKPLYPAIVWLDGRADKEAQELRKILPDSVFKKKTGLPSVDGYTPLAKLLYLKRNLPQVYEKTDKFLLLEDFVGFWLTGRIVSEKSLLSSSGYFDLTQDDIWEEALSTAGIDRNLLPEAVEPGSFVAQLRKEAADALGLHTGVALYAGAMDQVAGAVGCGNYSIGAVHETTGTAMIVATTLNLEDAMRRDVGLTVYRHAEKDKYLLLSIGRTATTILKWFAEQFFKDIETTDIFNYLSQVVACGTPGANGIILLPYFDGSIGTEGGENLKGSFWNVGLHNTQEDFVRAIFEGVAYMLQDNLDLVLEKPNTQKQLISIGGASKSRVWCQIKADVTGCEIVAMPAEEATLYGCACIAAVGSGLYSSLSAIKREKENRICFKPDTTDAEKYRRLYEKYKLLKKAMEQLSMNVLKLDC